MDITFLQNLHDTFMANHTRMTPEEIREFNRLLSVVEADLERRQGQEGFKQFIQAINPDFVFNWHHDEWCKEAEDIATNGRRRTMINTAPRHGKSLVWSVYFPAWYLGKFPGAKLMVLTHTDTLSETYGQQTRDIVESPAYRRIFPNTRLDPASKSKSNWRLLHLMPPDAQGRKVKPKVSETFYAGITAKLAGRGASLLLVDDPTSEQDTSDNALDTVWAKWPGILDRIQPGASVMIVMTRWAQRDLCGRILQNASNRKRWKVIKYPAILPNGDYLWNGWFDQGEWEEKRENTPSHEWNARYMQEPTSKEGAILKREWWSWWKNPEPPSCDFIMQTYDTSYGKNDASNFSVIQTWGVFKNNANPANMILLDKFKGRPDFVDLKKIAYTSYQKWKPDGIYIEDTSAGISLIQEMRRAGIPVVAFKAARNTAGARGDKNSKVNAIAPILESGIIWLPEGERHAEDLVEQCVAFPRAIDGDDDVDAFVVACMRLRQGGFLQLPSDFIEEEDDRVVEGEMEPIY